MKPDLSLKCYLFDLPSEIYMSTFTAFKLKSKSVSFSEYAEKRSNFEFLKEFNTLNLQSPCVTLINEMGDELNVNKGFLGLEDLEDLEEDEQKF